MDRKNEGRMDGRIKKIGLFHRQSCRMDLRIISQHYMMFAEYRISTQETNDINMSIQTSRLKPSILPPTDFDPDIRARFCE